mgnify:CR=1 FL=1
MEVPDFIFDCLKNEDGRLALVINVYGDLKAEHLNVGKLTVGNKVQTTKPATSAVRQKIVNTTFRYRWVDTHPECVGRLYQALRRAKIGGRNTGWIDSDTSPDDFANLFSGNPSGVQVKWTGTKQHLKYLFQTMLDRGYIYAPNRSKQPWVIVQSHFVPSFGRRFSDWDSEKEPVDYKDVIELMADLLNPDVSLEELMQLRQS